MTENNRKLPPDESATERQDGDRRRSSGRGKAPPSPKVSGTVGRDQLGNAVWEWRVDVPRRRDDDPTIDLLECLDVDGLSIEEDEEKKPLKKGNFNPYNKTR
jgi:hypothetical protein